MSELRQRKPVRIPAEKKEEEEEDNPRFGISFLDCARVLSGLLVLSCIFSWLITDGTSLTWGYRPRISRWRTLKGLFQPAVDLTDSELLLFDGSDSTRPIYVAINGSVFDVSANPGMYGPGGGYSFFAGRDAARAYVSGCFKTDLTHDLRGLEEMFITGKSREEDTKELEEIAEIEERKRQLFRAGALESGEKIRMDGRIRWLKGRREKRRNEAWEKVKAQIDHWDKFFREHDKYFYVGKVVHESLEGKPVPELCAKVGKKKPKSK